MSIIQNPIFHTEIKPLIQLTFLIQDIQDGYHETIHSIKCMLNCDNFVIQGGTTVYDNHAHNTITMLIPPAFITETMSLKDLKDFVKLICKRKEIICFFQYGTTQRVYDYRKQI
jgi:hypothetical protein